MTWKRILAVCLPLFIFCLSSFAQTDSLRIKALDEKLENYFSALETRSAGEKMQEVDFMIGSSPEGGIRNHVALKAYDHYLNSKLMGDEAVAIHITDEWFIPGKASMASDIDLLNARIYAEFNRRSLIGRHAPSLLLQTPDGDKVEALGLQSDSLAGGCGRYRVLFFYDTDCSKCAMETIMLRAMFREKEWVLDFIAVYTGDNREKWDAYRKERLVFEDPNVRVFHYWDPENDSDFQRKYGVLQTPRMFLIGKDGVILGRGLDTEALMKILDIYLAEPEYGDEKTMSLFSSILPEDDPQMTADSIIDIARYISRRTLTEKKDSFDYKRLAGNMLYYLVGKRGEAFAYGSAYIADSLVLGHPEIWNTPGDSLNVVGLAEIVSGLRNRIAVGSRIPKNLKVYGSMLSKRGEKTAEWSLGRLRAGTYVLFYTKGCANCDEELTSARSLVASDRKSRVLLVDMDEVQAHNPDMATRLFDSLDLSVLPFVMQTGRRHTLARKYLSLQSGK